MVTQNSKQSQKVKRKSQSVTFTIAVMKRKGITLRNHNGIWKIMRTPVLEFL